MNLKSFSNSIERIRGGGTNIYRMLNVGIRLQIPLYHISGEKGSVLIGCKETEQEAKRLLVDNLLTC